MALCVNKPDRAHRRQNKYSDKINLALLWDKTELTFAVSSKRQFNWLWQHSCQGTVADGRAELADRPWAGNLLSYLSYTLLEHDQVLQWLEGVLVD